MTDDERATQFVGMHFPHLDLDTASRMLLSPEGRGTAVPWRLVNTYCISLMRTEVAYTDQLRAPGINLPDGKPVAWVLQWLSRRSGSPVGPGHIRGPAFFSRVLDDGRRSDARHYLLGGTPETLERLQVAIAVRFPGACIAGAESPPFRPMTEAEREAQDSRIRASGAEFVWVGLGTPRQDFEAARLAVAVGRPAIAVGAAFDFLAGTRPEAPLWVQRMALEWLFRFVSEPGRLWRRYTVGLARFTAIVIGDLTHSPASRRVARTNSW